MPNERIYQIKINGVESSIDIVDKLIKKLEDLEKRINALSGKTVSVGASGGGSSKGKASDLTAEERVSKKIQQTAERIAEARTDEYKALQQAKSDLKEIERQQKAVAAAQNLSGENAKEYANTLDGMREKLSDMKRALGGIDIGSPEFDKQVQEIDALNNKIKQIEQSYGQFGRNVGNYANGVAEGLTKVTIKVGETERTFASAKEASRTLGNELKSMAVNGEQGTKAYSDLDAAFKQLQSTMKDVSASSQKMDMLLDTMKGFTALGSVGNGLSSLFGFDGSAIQESIQKLVALQNVMQGIETIQQQMTTKEGLGAIFSDASASIDQFVAKLTGAKVGLNGLEASSKTATVAVKGLSTAMKALSGLALAWALDKAVDQLKDLGSEVKSLWGDITGGERFTQEEQLANAIENVNRKLENRLQLINEDKSLSEWGKQSETINEVNKALKEQIGLYTELNKEGGSFWEKMQQYAGQGIDDVLSGKGLLKTFGSMTKEIANSISSFAAARKSNEELEKSVGSLGNSVKVASKQIEADANEMVQRWVKEIDKCDLATEEGRKQFQELARALDDDSVLNSVLLNLDRYFRSPETRAEIESIIAKIRQLRGELSAPLGSFTSNVSNYIKNGIAKAQKIIDDAHKKRETSSVGAAKSTGAKVGETVQQQEEEITRLRIRAMDEGLQKTIAEINFNAKKEIDALKLTGARKAEAEALIEKERQRKVREAEAKDYQERIEARRNFERELSQLESDNLNQRIENLETEGQHAIDALTKNIKIPKDNPIYKLYFDNEHPNRAQTYSINFDLALTGDERAKRLLEDKGNQAQYWINQMGNLKVSPRKANDMLKRLSETNEDDIKKSLSKFDDIAEEYFKTVQKIRNEILDPDEQEKIITDAAKQLTDKFEAAANEIGYSIYGGIRDFQYETRTDLYEDALKQRASYYKLILQQEIDNNNKVYNERVNSIKKLAQLERDELDDAARKQYGGEDNEAIWDVFLLSQQDVNESKEFIDQIASHYGELGESLKKNEITLESFIKELAKNYGGELGKQFANDKISLEEFRTYFDRFINDYKEKKEQINKSEKNRLFSLDVEKAKNDSQAITSVYDKTISTIEAMLSSTQQRYSVRMQSESTDAFGIINLSATKKIAKEAVAEYGLLKDQLEGLLQQIRTKFQNGEITLEDYEKEIGKLQPLWTKAVDGMQGAIANAPDFGDFLRSIMPYVSQLANGFQNIMSQVSSLMSAEFEAQRQKLDDEIALLEEKYNEMEELEQRHADKINAIEDEISNARGARRDHLVDMYNEEIAAQRRAFIEKQKLDAEMRRKEEEQKALERAERKRQNQIQFQQAIVSQALAIMNAFATKPFVPVGLAMGALATTLTGVQLVLMKKAQQASERYADGGVIQGKSHAQGGVKVLGGKAEVEGGEYITNKRTTALNQPVLEYINSKHRKLTAADFIDFYNGKGNKTIKNNFKTKFASGGALPSVSASKSNNIIVVKDESTPVVSVVDIINATDNYNQVRVLAGVD